MRNLCNICPRNCNIDRTVNFGFCGAKNLQVSKIMKHFWEEPIISGTNGSGTIFFSHCSLKCVFCQNFEISQCYSESQSITVNELAQTFKDLEDAGVHNINLVSPTHYTNEIIAALKIYQPKIPIVWNTSGYEKPENIKKLKNYVDIYLTDLKYYDSEISNKYSSAQNYFEFASKSILEMRKNQPEDIIENNIMKKGVIIRHLVLPSCYEDSMNILQWIYDNLGNKTYVSIMSQYTPCFNAKLYPEINRKLKPVEYKLVLSKLEKLGFENGFTQELTSATKDFIPEFKKNENF